VSQNTPASKKILSILSILSEKEKFVSQNTPASKKILSILSILSKKRIFVSPARRVVADRGIGGTGKRKKNLVL
jgi:hypothetical protein